MKRFILAGILGLCVALPAQADCRPIRNAIKAVQEWRAERQAKRSGVACGPQQFQTAPMAVPVEIAPQAQSQGPIRRLTGQAAGCTDGFCPLKR